MPLPNYLQNANGINPQMELETPAPVFSVYIHHRASNNWLFHKNVESYQAGKVECHLIGWNSRIAAICTDQPPATLGINVWNGSLPEEGLDNWFHPDDFSEEIEELLLDGE